MSPLAFTIAVCVVLAFLAIGIFLGVGMCLRELEERDLRIKKLCNELQETREVFRVYEFKG